MFPFSSMPAHPGSVGQNEKPRETTPANSSSPAVQTSRSDSDLRVREKAAEAAQKESRNGQEDEKEPRKEVFLTAVSESPQTAVKSCSE